MNKIKSQKLKIRRPRITWESIATTTIDKRLPSESFFQHVYDVSKAYIERNPKSNKLSNKILSFKNNRANNFLIKKIGKRKLNELKEAKRINLSQLLIACKTTVPISLSALLFDISYSSIDANRNSKTLLNRTFNIKGALIANELLRIYDSLSYKFKAQDNQPKLLSDICLLSILYGVFIEFPSARYIKSRELARRFESGRTRWTEENNILSEVNKHIIREALTKWTEDPFLLHNKVAKDVFSTMDDKPSKDKLFHKLIPESKNDDIGPKEKELFERAKKRIKYAYVLNVIRPIANEIGLMWGVKRFKMEDNAQNRKIILNKLQEITKRY